VPVKVQQISKEGGVRMPATLPQQRSMLRLHINTTNKKNKSGSTDSKKAHAWGQCMDTFREYPTVSF